MKLSLMSIFALCRNGAMFSSLLSSSSSSSLLASSPTASSSLNLVPAHQVTEMVASQSTESYTYQEFVEKVSSFGSGRISMSNFDPSLAQVEMFTSPKNSIDISRSIASDPLDEISKDLTMNLDIDQVLFCTNSIEQAILEFINATDDTPIHLQPLQLSADDAYAETIADASLLTTEMPRLEPYSFNTTRTTLLSTSINQLKQAVNNKKANDANQVIILLSRHIPHEHLMGFTMVDCVLKNIRAHDPNSKTSFDQFKHLASSAFVNVELGKNNSDVPLLVAVRASVSEVRKATHDIIAAWRNREDNPNSGASTSAENLCDSLSSWGSAEKVESVSMTSQSLQVAISLLTLARRQKEGNFNPREVNFMCESYNQKRSTLSVSFKMSVF